MDILLSDDDLICQHQHLLKRKTTAAVTEEVFCARTKNLEYHFSVLAFPSKPVDLRNHFPASEWLIHLELVKEE